jgi:1,2-phenylacetyl-CoA epoxidase PaaB subunit
MSEFYAYYMADEAIIEKLKSDNKQDARKEIQGAYLRRYPRCGIGAVQLLEIKSVENIDIIAINKKIKEERRQAEIKRVEAEERAQYEKLHVKFNKKITYGK